MWKLACYYNPLGDSSDRQMPTAKPMVNPLTNSGGCGSKLGMCRAERAEQGTQIVELAVVLPFLVLFAAIVIEGVGLVRAQQIMTNAARESARMAILPQNDPVLTSNHNMLQQIAICYAASNKLILTTTLPAACSSLAAANNCTSTTTPVTITPSPSNPTPIWITRSGQASMAVSRVQITCGYKLRFLPNLPWFNISASVPLSVTVEMRNVS